MTNRPLTDAPDPPDCRDAFERMPWMLNGSLPPLEVRALQDHAAQCARCQARLAVERELFVAIRQPAGNVQQAPLGAWGRLEAAIAGAGADRPAPQPAAVAAVPAVRRRDGLRLALTLQAAAIAVLSLALFWVLVARAPDGTPAQYRTVAAPDAALSAVGRTWRVVFDPATTPATATAVLAAHGLRVAAGPSAERVYTVVTLEGAAPQIDALRSAARVRLVEPVGDAAATTAAAGGGP